MSVTRTEQTTKRDFVGRAWKNIVKNESSKYKGTEFINITLDRDIQEVNLKQGDKIQLWPNNKREGKEETDADYRVSTIHDLQPNDA